MLEDGNFDEGPPLISPPMFINVVRQFIQSFGNIDGFNIMERALAVIDEAQIVATDLYGVGMTKRQQQQLMFEKKSISVWDLASYEEKSLLSGEEVPWYAPCNCTWCASLLLLFGFLLRIFYFSLININSIFTRKNDAYDDKGPDEVVGERVRRVGGQDQYDAELDPNTYL